MPLSHTKVLVIASQKGGAGKITTAINLAVAAKHEGREGIAPVCLYSPLWSYSATLSASAGDGGYIAGHQTAAATRLCHRGGSPA